MTTTDDKLDRLIELAQLQLRATSGAERAAVTAALRGGGPRGGGMGLIGAAEVAGIVQNLGKESGGVSDSFREVAKAGANFSGDIYGMNQAAAESRMSFQKLSEFIQDNVKDMAGLGGSAVRGAEQFTKLSDELHRSDQEYRMMGYSMEDINQLLVQNLATTRVVDMQNEHSRQELLESTLNYAKELDTLSKITGKERAIKAEELKKVENQAAFNAKMELLRRKLGPEEFKAVQTNINAALANAEAVGKGALFMESFARDGAISSQQAQLQFALGGEKIYESAMLFGKGMVEEGKKVEAAGIDQALVEANSETSLQLTRFNTSLKNGVGEAMVNQSLATQTQRDGLAKIAQGHGQQIQEMSSYADLIKEQREDVEKAQKGLDTGGTRQNQILEASTKIAKHMDDASVMLYNSVKDFGGKAELNNIAEKISNLVTTNKDIATMAADVIKGNKDILDSIKQGNFSDAATKSIEAITPAANSFVESLTKLGKSIEEFTLSLNHPGRKTGSYGTTGKLFEDFGTETTVNLHGMESVVTPDQMNTIVSNSYDTGIGQSVSMMSGIMEALPDQFKEQIDTSNDINVAQITDDLNKSITEMFPDTSGIFHPADVVNDLQDQFKSVFNIDEFLPKIAASTKPKGENPPINIKKPFDINVQEFAKQINDMSNAVKTPNLPEVKNTRLNDTISTSDFDFSQGFPQLKSRMSTEDKNKEQQKPAAQPTQTQTSSEQQKPSPDVKKQTDVLSSMLAQLELLNKNIMLLTSQHEEFGKKQVKATKQLNGNAFYQ